MMQALRTALAARWQRWWEARLPRQDELTLSHRNLYILPTRAGWGFAAVFLILLLASINEQLNLGYALSFLLAGAALASLYQTHGNLQGIRMRLQGSHSVHAGQPLTLDVRLSNAHRRRGRLGLSLYLQPDAQIHLEVPPQGDTDAQVAVPATQRGWMTLPRITVHTTYPLGLFRAWSYWRPQTQVLVWPALDPTAPPLPESPGEEDAAAARPSTDATQVPESLREYRRGDPLKWIAWKKSTMALSTGGVPVSREPGAGRAPDLWLDFSHTPGLTHLGAEARLSRLASWLIEAEQAAQSTGMVYGLKLPGQAIAPNKGVAHLRECLDTLATWQSGASA